jgi:hypothetical protein
MLYVSFDAEFNAESENIYVFNRLINALAIIKPM